VRGVNSGGGMEQLMASLFVHTNINVFARGVCTCVCVCVCVCCVCVCVCVCVVRADIKYKQPVAGSHK
jgi:hypothetical protein